MQSSDHQDVEMMVDITYFLLGVVLSLDGLHKDLLMLTNQFNGAWTHYTHTPQGTQTDHMVGCQRILIE